MFSDHVLIDCILREAEGKMIRSVHVNLYLEDQISKEGKKGGPVCEFTCSEGESGCDGFMDELARARIAMEFCSTLMAMFPRKIAKMFVEAFEKKKDESP